MSAHVWRCVAVACLGVAVGACAPRRIPPPQTPAPRVARPAQAIPADLDLAIRFDLEAGRRVLGAGAAEMFDWHALDASDPDTTALVEKAIARADTLWLALRPGLPAPLTDNVLILRGDLGALAPARDEWSGPVDLGADWRRFERPSPERRAAPARIYLHSEELAVFVSEAEIDSTELVVEEAAVGGALDPPARGLVSFAARVRPLLRHLRVRFPRVVDVLRTAGKATGYANVDSTGLVGEIEIEFSEPAHADRATEAAGALFDRLELAEAPWGQLARATDRQAVGTKLVLRITLGSHTLGALIPCMTGGKCG